MADRRPRSRHVDLEYTFDRLLARKLEQAYDILVPDRVRRTGEQTGLSGETDEGCRDLRPGVVRSTEVSSSGQNHTRTLNRVL